MASASTSKLTASLLEKEIKAIFASPSFDFESESEKSIRKQVMDRLAIEGKFPSDKKALFKKVLTRVVQQQDDEVDGDDEDEREDDESVSSDKGPAQISDDDNALLDSDDDENVDPAPKPHKKLAKKKESPPSKKKKVTKKGKNTTTKAKTTKSVKKTKKSAESPTAPPASASYGPKVQSLIKLGQAMRMGPRLHAGLKEMKDDQARMEALTQRLRDAGASWAGKVPSAQEIAAAKAKKQRQDDLDGLDQSLIIEGGRRRRGAAVNYAQPNPFESEEEEEEDEFNEEEAKRPAKKRKSPKNQDNYEEEEDSEDGDFQGDSGDDDEDDGEESDSDAEFED